VHNNRLINSLNNNINKKKLMKYLERISNRATSLSCLLRGSTGLSCPSTKWGMLKNSEFGGDEFLGSRGSGLTN
jgi:hypothetical protein